MCVEVKPTVSSRYLSTSWTSSGSFPIREVTFLVPMASFSNRRTDHQGPCFWLPHSTRSLWLLLWVVGPCEDGPISPFRAEPNWTPWTKSRALGARLWIPSQGLTPGQVPDTPLSIVHRSLLVTLLGTCLRTPSPCLAPVHKSFFLFKIMRSFNRTVSDPSPRTNLPWGTLPRANSPRQHSFWEH